MVNANYELVRRIVVETLAFHLEGSCLYDYFVPLGLKKRLELFVSSSWYVPLIGGNCMSYRTFDNIVFSDECVRIGVQILNPNDPTNNIMIEVLTRSSKREHWNGGKSVHFTFNELIGNGGK